MKKIIFVLLLGICNSLSYSQVVMNLQLPPAGITTKEQLWSISLVNSGSYDLNVTLEMQFTDAANNQRVFTAVTNQITLAKGVKQIRQADIMPVTYNIINSSYNVDANPSGLLPVGVFNVCYTVVSTGGHMQELVSDECETIEVEPLSPPILIYPSDAEQLETSRPLFTWSPPAPINLFSRLNYELTLVEVLPLQSPSDAVQQNIPLYFSPDINFTNLQYPATLKELDTAKIYAWRIKAKNNYQPIANSEVWTFSVLNKNTTLPKRINYSDYVKPAPQQNASYFVCDGIVNYQYNNIINDSILRVRIYDITT
ncbi:MAG: hypothetical protein J7497_15635, partial [Chitinophagaceae bacterium]|nr:hypothetical protein [Chitinophagaceae bacterium]